MATTRQFVSSLVRRQTTKSIFSTTCQRSLHTTLTRFNLATNEKKNFAETLTDKFIGQVKRQQQGNYNNKSKMSTAEATRFVQIDALPHTATTEDVYKLAREAFTGGDKSIIETVFCRNFEFNFYGRAVVLMSTPEDARKLVEYGNRRSVGGNIIKMTFIGSVNSEPNSIMGSVRRSELISMTDSTSASGRSVIISGFPRMTHPDHLLGFLRSRNFFPMEGAPDNVITLKTKEQSTVSKFLVKFDSESEAWRCVRQFHNTNFLFQKKNQNYKLSLSVAY